MANTGSSETRVQDFVHALEQGRFAPFIRGFLIFAVLAALALMYLGWQFRGFAIPEAMDQAQIARQIATGQGWTTELIRPLAIWQIKTNLGAAPQGAFPDTFNAPLPPLVNALAIKLAGPKISFGPNEYIMPVERFIVALSMLCFLASTVVQFFLLRRLFDQRLAVWAVALTLLSNMCWQFTLSGLPQMLMLLLFNLALYALTRAVEINVALTAIAAGNAPAATGEASRPGPRVAVLLWLAVVGVLFGLLTLSHGLAVWFFLGLLIFVGFSFRQRGPVLLVLLAAFAVVYAPWLVRTYHVSGSPFGVAIYGTFEGVGISTADRMRSADGPHIDGIEPRFFRPKTEEGIIDEVEHLPGDFGGGVVALAFFFGLMHVFRRRETGAMRLAILLMWITAVIGMAVTRTHGSVPGGVDPDQLQMLFLPVMTGYGLAFLLVLFSRREAGTGVLGRIILFAVLLLLTAVPMIFTLLPTKDRSPVQYPPYFQPAIHKLGDWTASNEIIGSDMPWAVAWYADRESLWIPLKLHDFMGLSDDGELNGPLAGIFLTQISRDTPFLSSLYRGDYQDYEPLIFARTDLPLFPFHEETLPMGDLSYSFTSDTKRWEKPASK
jgi:4-amino-4-deoxy-L-arabinose transferase-like glycosyltransferase